MIISVVNGIMMLKVKVINIGYGFLVCKGFYYSIIGEFFVSSVFLEGIGGDDGFIVII